MAPKKARKVVVSYAINNKPHKVEILASTAGTEFHGQNGDDFIVTTFKEEYEALRYGSHDPDLSDCEHANNKRQVLKALETLGEFEPEHSLTHTFNVVDRLPKKETPKVSSVL